MIGRPKDGFMAFCAEKCNCTQVAMMMFDAIGHGEASKQYTFIHDYKWGPYAKNNPPPSMDDIRLAKKRGCVCLKFVRDPLDRFVSIYKRYRAHGIRTAPPNMSVDEFIDWLGTLNLLRYSPQSFVFDDHILSQALYGETDDLWTDIIHVESFRDPKERDRLEKLYTLRIDPSWTSDHWIEGTFELTDDQRERVMNVYAMDKAYRLK